MGISLALCGCINTTARLESHHQPHQLRTLSGEEKKTRRHQGSRHYTVDFCLETGPTQNRLPSKMNSPWGLALLCGICLASFGWADNVSENTKRDIQKLTDHFNVTADKALFGSTIFLKDLSNLHMFEESEQKLLLQEILDVYVRILSDMQNHTQDIDVKKNIIQVRGRVEDLRNSYYQSGEQTLKGRLQDLWAVKTNDAVVQRKAVREMLSVFQKASQLHSWRRKKSLRHRRDARRVQLEQSGPKTAQY
ncbi:hypothetical protein AAFF_G00369170 [Aldrovandia affinis]|uniref:Interferon gamma n=1 Tax=Aldrovandia affinis TaxID=143900 RepID=A0AAD7SH67_9TELE|nr:hypothetical protein AAFF_G00369170 [Aldrovandia affinis]